MLSRAIGSVATHAAIRQCFFEKPQWASGKEEAFVFSLSADVYSTMSAITCLTGSTILSPHLGSLYLFNSDFFSFFDSKVIL